MHSAAWLLKQGRASLRKRGEPAPVLEIKHCLHLLLAHRSARDGAGVVLNLARATCFRRIIVALGVVVRVGVIIEVRGGVRVAVLLRVTLIAFVAVLGLLLPVVTLLVILTVPPPSTSIPSSFHIPELLTGQPK